MADDCICKGLSSAEIRERLRQMVEEERMLSEGSYCKHLYLCPAQHFPHDPYWRNYWIPKVDGVCDMCTFREAKFREYYALMNERMAIQEKIDNLEREKQAQGQAILDKWQAKQDELRSQ